MTGVVVRRGLRRLVVGGVMGLAAFSPSLGRAQQPRTYTLEDVLTSLRRGADTLDLARVSPVQSQALDSVSIMLRTAGAAALTIDQLAAIVTKSHATFGDVARWNPQPHAAWAEPWFYDALVRLRRIANAAGSGIGPRLVAAFGSSVADHFIHRWTARDKDLRRRRQRTPSCVDTRSSMVPNWRLNIAEVLINYIVARPSWSPLAPGEDGPSPFELVGLYTTSDLTNSRSEDDKFFRPHVISGAYTGVRYYRFGAPNEHVGRIKAFLAPQHLGVGAFFIGSTDRALISPFEDGHRTGGFLEWGIARGAVTVGDNWRVVIGVGKQILPYLF